MALFLLKMWLVDDDTGTSTGGAPDDGSGSYHGEDGGYHGDDETYGGGGE